MSRGFKGVSDRLFDEKGFHAAMTFCGSMIAKKTENYERELKPLMEATGFDIIKLKELHCDILQRPDETAKLLRELSINISVLQQMEDWRRVAVLVGHEVVIKLVKEEGLSLQQIVNFEECVSLLNGWGSKYKNIDMKQKAETIKNGQSGPGRDSYDLLSEEVSGIVAEFDTQIRKISDEKKKADNSSCCVCQ